MAELIGHEAASLHELLRALPANMRVCANCGADDARTVLRTLGHDSDVTHSCVAVCQSAHCATSMEQNMSASQYLIDPTAERDRARAQAMLGGPSALRRNYEAAQDGPGVEPVDADMAGALRRFGGALFGLTVWDSAKTPQSSLRSVNVMRHVADVPRFAGLDALYARGLEDAAGAEALRRLTHPLAINPSRYVVIAPPLDVLDAETARAMTPEEAARALRHLSMRLTMGLPLGALNSNRSSASFRSASADEKADEITVGLVLGGDRAGALWIKAPQLGRLSPDLDVRVPIKHVWWMSNGTILEL